MGDFILVLNAGSSSLKFTLFECFGEVLRTAYGGQIEGLFTEPLFRAKDAAGRVAAEEAWPAGTPFGHDGALEALFAWGRTILGGGDRIAAVGQPRPGLGDPDGRGTDDRPTHATGGPGEAVLNGGSGLLNFTLTGGAFLYGE